MRRGDECKEPSRVQHTLCVSSGLGIAAAAINVCHCLESGFCFSAPSKPVDAAEHGETQGVRISDSPSSAHVVGGGRGPASAQKRRQLAQASPSLQNLQNKHNRLEARHLHVCVHRDGTYRADFLSQSHSDIQPNAPKHLAHPLRASRRPRTRRWWDKHHVETSQEAGNGAGSEQ